MVTILRRYWQRPRCAVAAGDLAVFGFSRTMLMSTTETDDRHTTSATRKGVERDDRDEQDGEWTGFHGLSIPRLPRGVA